MCCCGRVRGRWVDPLRGTALFNESLDPMSRDELETLARLAEARYQAMRVLGVNDEETLDEFVGEGWLGEWKELFDRLARVVGSDCGVQPCHAWMVGIHNAVLLGAFERLEKPWQFGRPPSGAEYHAWQEASGYVFQTEESMIIRIRPGYSSDTKMADFLHFVSGSWTRPEIEVPA